MKIQSLVMTLAIAASTTLSGIAFAQTATPVVDQKAANQQQRINQGVASGELTRGEATLIGFCRSKNKVKPVCLSWPFLLL